MNIQFGRFLEDFSKGETIKHNATKTVLESDNNLFTLLTMNHHPVHLDIEYCKTKVHGKILVVGTYVLSLVVGFTVPDISGKAIANLDYERVTHDGPVFIGDTLHAETLVLDVRESKSKNDRGVVYVETCAYNQDGKKVLTFRRHVLVPKKNV